MIHYFNPGHENAVLNSTPAYTAPASMTTLANELAALPIWYASSEDVVLVPEKYDLAYYDSLRLQLTSLPALIKSKKLKEYNHSTVSMWGVSPQAIRVFEAYNKNLSLNLKLPTWHEEFVYLNSRTASRDILKECIDSSSHFSTLSLPMFFTDLAPIEQFVKESPIRLLAKAPYSSSGRGLLWLPLENLTQCERQNLQGMLNKQTRVSIERVLDNRLDFAMEFIVDEAGKVQFEGYSLFTTNTKGAYLGNYLHNQEAIEKKLLEYIEKGILEEAKQLLSNILIKYCKSTYKGCIGVDMMVYFDTGEYKLHPCLEINLRYNMGYLALQFCSRYLSHKSHGNYSLSYNSSGNLYTDHLKMNEEFPLIIKDGKIESGYLSLCPVHKESKYRAYILTEKL